MPKVSDAMQMAFDALDAFVDDDKNQVDPHRIYVMGLSMGGYGTWDAIQRRPNFFAAAVPICGGGDKKLAKKRALDDALYLASLRGGAKVDGYSNVDSFTRLNENLLVRPASTITDFVIIDESNDKTLSTKVCFTVKL